MCVCVIGRVSVCTALLQVGLTTEYAQATSQLSSLQLEIGNLHKSENEMKQQLATAVAQVQRSAQDLTILTQKYEGNIISIGNILILSSYFRIAVKSRWRLS